MKRKKIITESDLKSFLHCPYHYYLRKYVGLSHVPLSGFSAQALFFQNMRRSLYELRDSRGEFPWEYRAGSELKMAEEMNKEELQKYLKSDSPESFKEFVQSKWMKVVHSGQYAGREVFWNFSGQPYSANKDLGAAAEYYYKFVLENGAPKYGFIEKDFFFEWDKFIIKTKFPELRGGPIIDEPKRWAHHFPDADFHQSDADESLAITLRILGMQALSKNPFYSLKLGISNLGLEDILYRCLNASEDKIETFTRNQLDVDTLRESIEFFLEKTSQEYFEPNPRGCGTCPANILGYSGKVVCSESNKSTKPAVPKYYYIKKNFRIEVEQDEGEINIIGKINNSKNDKTVAVLKVSFSESDGPIRVNSNYTSNIYGMGFEEQILDKVDEQLQLLANSRGARVSNFLDYERDFKFAGQKNIKHRIEKLGYVYGLKEYIPVI